MNREGKALRGPFQSLVVFDLDLNLETVRLVDCAGLRTLCRIQFCDTAECNSALPGNGGSWIAVEEALYEPSPRLCSVRGGPLQDAATFGSQAWVRWREVS